MDKDLTIKEFFDFAAIHANNKDLQFNLTKNETEVLLHALGYYRQGYISVASAEWRNAFDNGINDREYYTTALKNLCELHLMSEMIVHKNYVYHATELGKKVARIKYVQHIKEERKKVKIGRRRYECFMDMNDTDLYEDFGDWLNRHKYNPDWEKYKLMYGIQIET